MLSIGNNLHRKCFFYSTVFSNDEFDEIISGNTCLPHVRTASTYNDESSIDTLINANKIITLIKILRILLFDLFTKLYIMNRDMILDIHTYIQGYIWKNNLLPHNRLLFATAIIVVIIIAIIIVGICYYCCHMMQLQVVDLVDCSEMCIEPP